MTFLTPLISLRDELLLFELNHFPCKVKLCQTKNELTKDGRNSRSSSEQASGSILSLRTEDREDHEIFVHSLSSSINLWTDLFNGSVFQEGDVLINIKTAITDALPLYCRDRKETKGLRPLKDSDDE